MKNFIKLIFVNMLVFFTLLLIVFVFFETYLRLSPGNELAGGRDSAAYYLNKLMKDDVLRKNYFGKNTCKTKYRDYYYFSFVCKSEKINTSDYYDARLTPDSSKNRDAKIAWMFGGSTLLNLTAPDELTIANQVAVHAKKYGVALKVVNFGMSGFASSPELVKYIDLLRRVPREERPDVVVFYDGYNDAAQSATFGAGNLQEDLNGKIRSVVENQTELLPSIISNYFSEYSFAWAKWVAPTVQGLYFDKMVSKRPPVESVPEKAVSLYIQNTRIAKAISHEYGIQVLFVLQPMIFTKNNLTDMEKDVMRYVVEPNRQHLEYMKNWYDLTKKNIRDKPDYFDATAVMDGRVDDDYIDHGHMGPESGVVVAQPIAERVMVMLKGKLGKSREQVNLTLARPGER